MSPHSPPGTRRALSRAAQQAAACATLVLLGCGNPGADTQPDPQPEGVTGSEASTACPAQAQAPDPLPGITPEHQTLAYWVERAAAYGDVDAALLTPEEAAAHALAMSTAGAEDGPIGQVDLLQPLRTDLLLRSINERFTFLRERFQSGAFVLLYLFMTTFNDLRTIGRLAAKYFGFD